MELFKNPQGLLEIVTEQVGLIGGEMAGKTFRRLVEELNGTDPLVAIERSISYIFDRAGSVLMGHIGRRVALESQALHNFFGLPTNDYRLSMELKYPIIDTLKNNGIEPTRGMLCSLCKGYMQGTAERINLGNLREVVHREGVCQFFFGGEENGPAGLQPEPARAGGNN
ncbi:MAG: hypothetical protein ACK42C_00670 [Aquificaceae bacterium]|jgi:hypothetical protein|uniref:hypothetical protein n=1 Tax=Hydrogenobacter sp. Uz 6-8 TaxID=3384828 RepID=UPI0030B5098F